MAKIRILAIVVLLATISSFSLDAQKIIQLPDYSAWDTSPIIYEGNDHILSARVFLKNPSDQETAQLIIYYINGQKRTAEYSPEKVKDVWTLYNFGGNWTDCTEDLQSNHRTPCSDMLKVYLSDVELAGRDAMNNLLNAINKYLDSK